MEPDTKPDNAENTLSDGVLDARVLGAWRKAAFTLGLSREREVDSHWSVLGVGSHNISGFAYPGIGSRVYTGPQDGPEHPEGDREASFNKVSQAEED